MTYSVLLLGATGLIGRKIARELSNHKSSLKRVAFLTPTANAGQEKEEKYSKIPLERVVGALEDTNSYKCVQHRIYWLSSEFDELQDSTLSSPRLEMPFA